MGKVTEFLLRWLFLANLIDDRIDIQNVPPPIQVGTNPMSYGGHGQYGAPPVSEANSVTNSVTNSANSAPTSSTFNTRNAENEWRLKCRQGIAMYPPGTPRRIALDSLRVEIVQNLASQLQHADQVLRRHAYKTLNNQNVNTNVNYNPSKNNVNTINGNAKIQSNNVELNKNTEILLDLANPDSVNTSKISTLWTNVSSDEIHINSQERNEDNEDNEDDDEQVLEDSLLDADLEIVEALRHATGPEMRMYMPNHPNHPNHPNNPNQELNHDPPSEQTQQQVLAQAQTLLMEAREYLPQLVSVVLHSRGALTPQPSLDPIQAMRKLLITRCLEDPSLGIELCWLLEAEVGRAWKSLFEHRQQTGRRLIVVLPAEKARVIAKIGTEKKSAFDLLQDAEQATAYGCTPTMSTSTHQYNSENPYEYDTNAPPPLPAALSLKRCSHFGDTMHFVDSLTQISLDLRMLPILERNAYLVNRLNELNRRLRRRMITRGAVSLDVEDSLTCEDWPHLSDVTSDMLRYSVHFPLEPKCVVWEGGNDHPSHADNTNPQTSSISSASSTPSASSAPKQHPKIKTGVMRVLNIVASESRILASRERCPFLVQIEVAETGLEGSDARLYAGGGVDGGKSAGINVGGYNAQTEAGFGVSLEEVIRLFAASKQKKEKQTSLYDHQNKPFAQQRRDDFPTYHIPTELLSRDFTILSKPYNSDEQNMTSTSSATIQPPKPIEIDTPKSISTQDVDLPRGGWQPGEDGSFFPNVEGDYGSPGSSYNVYNDEIMRQQDYQSAHEPIISNNIHHQNQGQQYSKEHLLDSIFGTSWLKKCEQIRQSSPYGKTKGWRLASFIMKAGEDIRREALVMQVISKLQTWFEQDIPASRRPFLRPYTIMCVGGDAGLLECIPDAKSVDEVKKRTEGFTTLRDFFERAYGSPTQRLQPQHPNQFSQYRGPGISQQNSYYSSLQVPPPQNSASNLLQSPPPPPSLASFDYNDSVPENDIITFEQAQDNFLRSLVGYSLVCFILQIKDRHNANILIDRKGHLLHIDFGFVLGDTPKMGKVPLFSERAPFKLTTEFWEVIGGWKGQGVRFCKMFEAAFECASSHAEEIASLVEAAVLNLTSNPERARSLADGVRSRLRMRGAKDSAEQKMFIMDLVNSALTSWGTSTYDWLQKSMNGYQ